MIKKLFIALALVAALLMAGVAALVNEPASVEIAIPEDATAVLNELRFAQPDAWQWQMLEGEWGSVRVGFAAPAAARGVIVLLPGYSAPLEIYFESISSWLENNYAVVALDWPSQGGSKRGIDGTNKIHALSLDNHLKAAARLFVMADEQFPGLDQYLVGISMGGQLAARSLAGEPDRFQAAALVTPALGLYGGHLTASERAVLKLLKAAGFGERFAPGRRGPWQFDMDVHTLTASNCSHPNPRTQLWQSWMVAKPAVRVDGLTNAFALAMDDSARISRSAPTLRAIKTPVWMPLAGNDFYVDSPMAEQACKQMSQCEVTWYEQARHCIFEEADEFYLPLSESLLTFFERHATK